MRITGSSTATDASLLAPARTSIVLDVIPIVTLLSGLDDGVATLQRGALVSAIVTAVTDFIALNKAVATAASSQTSVHASVLSSFLSSHASPSCRQSVFS